MNKLFIDIETIPDSIAEDLQPTPKYGKTKDPVKKAIIEEKFETEKIKTMSVHPMMCKIVSIQTISDSNGIERSYENNERRIISSFWEVYKKHDLIVGAGHINFDLPVLIFRSKFLGIEHPDVPLRKYSSFPLFCVLNEAVNWKEKKRKGLDWLARRLGLMGKTGHGSQVYELYLEGKFNDIHEYCMDDVIVLKEVYKRLWHNS